MLAQWVLRIEWASTGAKWLARLMGSFFLLALIEEGHQKKNIEEEKTHLLGVVSSNHGFQASMAWQSNTSSKCEKKIASWANEEGENDHISSIQPLNRGSELSGLGTLDLSYFDSRWLPTAWINSSIIARYIHSIHSFQTNQSNSSNFVCFRFGFELNQTHFRHPAIHPSILYSTNLSSYKEVQGLREPSQILWLRFPPSLEANQQIPDLSWPPKPTHDFRVRKNWTSFRKKNG